MNKKTLKKKHLKKNKQTQIKALNYSYLGRKKKKNNTKKIWIKKINAYLKLYKNYTYNKFILNLKKKKIIINKKIFSIILFYTNKKNILTY